MRSTRMVGAKQCFRTCGTAPTDVGHSRCRVRVPKEAQTVDWPAENVATGEKRLIPLSVPQMIVSIGKGPVHYRLVR